MNIETLQEIVCQAHMAGQHDQGGIDPSWSEAFTYWISEVKPKLTSDNSDYEAELDKLLCYLDKKLNPSEDTDKSQLLNASHFS